MNTNVSRKLIADHLMDGTMDVGSEIALKIDQTLAQDATGTLAMLEFEAMSVPRVRTELSVQYVDHNLLQEDFKNPDDHLFLYSACRKFGLWYSRPGNGVSHPVHMERFGVPGKTLLGCDSHTCAAGALGMLAIGTGGLEVALAMAGEPFRLRMPKIWGVRLVGKLPDWVSAKDVILEMLRRHGVSGGLGKIVEYHGPGLEQLTAMDRHVIANMGAELGATTTVFPADDAVRIFLKSQGREHYFRELIADPEAQYDEEEEIDLSGLEPLIAMPGSPGNVVPVREIAGREIYQAYIGSSANPGLRDFAIPALMVEGRQVHPRVSFDVNPTSRQILENLIDLRLLAKLIRAGARLHQAGCNGCIGMGQAPATHRISLRTVPRNFPGRSGTHDDLVYLCSPETATASALMGTITDPRDLPMPYPIFKEPQAVLVNKDMLVGPNPQDAGIALDTGPNIRPLPRFPALEETQEGPVLLKVGDNVSTDEIMPAGAKVLPFRSNIPAISEFVFAQIDTGFYQRTLPYREQGFFVVGGENYGQGSSREHAALAPRYLGLRAVLAKSFARIHHGNLVNFGIVPLVFLDPENWGDIGQEDVLRIESLRSALAGGASVVVENVTRGRRYEMRHGLSRRQIDAVLAGGLINSVKPGRPD
ncbi:aconitate hydratase [Methylosarcina fibrata]|uniref:aconitate hydratase n=1 Tax=Methylosarcina fibrata TaxID=105972 RepID=UPI0003752BCA|nr:aconitate hydratase [Methylosarcina fibrata]